MNDKNQVIKLLKNKAVLVRDFLIGATTFRVIDGLSVKRFPLSLLREMKREGIVETTGGIFMYSTYKLVPKKKKDK